SPARSDVLLATSRTMRAPRFSMGSGTSISFATVTPSFVIVGDPNFLSMTTLRPLGPSVTLTASASWLTPLRIACRDCSPYVISFAIAVPSPLRSRRRGILLVLFRGDGGCPSGSRRILDRTVDDRQDV